MNKHLTYLFSIPLLTAPIAMAQDAGEVVYKQMCAACHGQDGKGVAGGAFPPLEGSDWVKGDTDRVAQILLHGLTGPVEVKGKTYNLMMPPQGALSEKQKVDVLNYVRSKWGTEKKAYTMKDLTAAKKKSEKRSKPWTAAEILKMYPLPGEEAHLHNLIMTVYHGKWATLPDFSKVKGNAVEEEHGGFITLERINRKKEFGIVWQGEIQIPKDGKYVFEIDSDDASRLTINGKQVAHVKGSGPMGRTKSGSITLKAGRQDLVFEYVQGTGQQGIMARFKPEKSKKWMWLSEKTKVKPSKKSPIIDLTPSDNKVRIYNNFIAGSTPRGIAVGFPQGKHYSFSTQYCTPDLLWAGKFISGGRHWTNRGQGAEAPLEADAIKLSNSKPAWVAESGPAAVQFKGYKMDASGNPTLRYTVQGSSVEEVFLPSSNAMMRTVTFTSGVPKSLELTLKESFSGAITGNSAPISEGVSVSLKEGKATLKNKGNKLVVTDLTPETKTLTFEYKWTN